MRLGEPGRAVDKSDNRRIIEQHRSTHNSEHHNNEFIVMLVSLTMRFAPGVPHRSGVDLKMAEPGLGYCLVDVEKDRAESGCGLLTGDFVSNLNICHPSL